MISYGEFLEKLDAEKTNDKYYNKYVNQGHKFESLINSLDSITQGIDQIENYISNDIVIGAAKRVESREQKINDLAETQVNGLYSKFLNDQINSSSQNDGLKLEFETNN